MAGLYDRGLATCEDVAVASRNLMRARLDLVRDRRSRLEAITAHLRRVEAVLARERATLKSLNRSTRGSAATGLIRGELLRDVDAMLLDAEKARDDASE